MKIQILDRFDLTSEWHEFYANGDLLFEGESPPQPQFQVFLGWLANQPDVDVEVRVFLIEYEHKEGEEYMPPIRSMTGELYWSDWENAERE